MKTLYQILATLCALSTLNAGVWPAGGELEYSLFPGATVHVTWDNALEADTVRIELWDGERHVFRTLSTMATTTQPRYSWTIPPDVHPGSLYRFVVRDAQNPARAEFSAGFHQIRSRGDVALTVEDDPATTAELVVSPLPASERARIAWTKFDAVSIDLVDMQGAVVQRIEPPRSTRACVAMLSGVRTGSYVVVARMTNGKVLRTSLLVTH